MIQIVHWKDIVGAEFMPVFVRVERSIFFARNEGAQIIDHIWSKFTPEERDMWERKRAWMRRCGYEDDGFTVRLHGWHGTGYLEHEQGQKDLVLRFQCSAPKDRRHYITVTAWMDWIKGIEQLNDEAAYYDTPKLAKETTYRIDKGKKPRVDDVFTHETDN